MMKGRVKRSLSVAAVLLVVAGSLLALPTPAPAYTAGAYTWTWQNPYPRDRLVTSVSAASATVSWAVGDYGQIYRYSAGTLTRQTSPTTNNLYAVDALPGGNLTTAWAVGQAGTIIYTTNSGATWTAQTSNTTYDLTGVAVISTSNIYAVGGYDGFTNAVILHYNGTAWSVQQTYATGGLNDIYAIDANNIWAVGQTPGVNTGHTLFCNGSTWVERDTNYAMISVSAYTNAGIYYVWGVTWDGTVIRSINGGASYTAMFNDYWPASISAVDSNNVWAAGWDGTIKKYNGTNWTAVPQTSNTTTDIYDVSAYSTAGQFCVGYSNFLSDTNTANWTVRTGSVATNNLNGCVSYGTDEVWAVGDGGVIVHSADGGATWATQTSGIAWNIREIDAADASTLYFIGNNRRVRKTINGGTSWAQTTGSPANTTWYGIAVANANTVWVAGTGGNLSKTTNGGTGWSAQASGTANIIEDIDCVDTNNAMLVGDAGTIRTTTNGGTNWTTRTSNTTSNLMSVSMANSSVAWAVGVGGVIRYTADGGANWQTQASPTAQTLNGVSAIDTTHAWAVSATGQILYRDGTSWSVHTTPAPSALNHVFAWDASNAWAVGATGNILFADPPYIKSVSPDYGDPGDTVDIEVVGGYTHFSAATPTLDFGAGVSMVPGSLNVVDNTTLFAQVQVAPGAALGPRDVQVTTGPETPVPLIGGFNVGSNPTVTSASPTQKPRGWTGDVEVTGSQTSFDDSSRATFGSGVVVNSTTYVNSRRVVANVSIGANAVPGARNVNVITGAQTPSALAGGFTVATPPRVTGLSPASGPPGSVVTITGTGFGAEQYPPGGAQASSVSFNGLPGGPVTEWSDTQIRCAIPTGVTSGPVTVVTGEGTSNSNKLFSTTSPVWYLPEGSTAWGFDTDISVMNPNTTTVTARVTYLTGSGPVRVPDFRMAPMSRTTLDPTNQGNLWPTDFSTKVECLEGLTISAERTMSWKGPGAAAGEGHSSIGVDSPANRWYLPEGSTAWGFECWLLLMNPNTTEARCTVTYMIEGTGTKTVSKTVPANSRASFNMADDVVNADASITVSSDIPVIPERSMYRNDRREGHDSIGTTTPANDFYLAEGSTAWGFTTYVLVQNPNASPADVVLMCMAPDGSARSTSFGLAGLSRRTVRLNDIMPGQDVSTRVHADLPIVAERSMYWTTGNGEASHDSIGVPGPRTTWYLADGRSGRGSGRSFETFTLVQNPNATPVDIEVTYLTADGAANRTLTDTVPANSRRTYDMADKINDAYAGVVVTSKTAGKGVIAEGSIYWDGRSAGTCTVGQ
jgi:photosystem II stability/assembly factor-like uncharacterized protein